MSDRERPLCRRISLRAMHFGSELARCQRYRDEAIDHVRASEWRPFYESDAEYGRRIDDFLREPRERFLHVAQYLAEVFVGNAPLTLCEPIHAMPKQYFDDVYRQLDQRDRERQGGGH